eukprot:1629246-Rhodomonas_salina.1
MRWWGVLKKTSLVQTLTLCVVASSLGDKWGQANTFSVQKQHRPVPFKSVPRCGRHTTDPEFQDGVVLRLLALRGGRGEIDAEAETRNRRLAARHYLESEAQAARQFIEGGEIVPFSFPGRPLHLPEQAESKQRALSKKRAPQGKRRTSRPGTPSNPITGLDTYGVSHIVPPSFSCSDDSSQRGGIHPLRALAGAPISDVEGSWGAWEKTCWAVIKEGVRWLLKGVERVCEKLAVLEEKYEEVSALLQGRR